ncbi:hypothetical protein PG997_012780 [Apiospora hydei]|uniref:Heterokaryon incompatibility domain-containing protein n=1 Tax=Apiospora hydei TaxID=1337664 RepID=A0ABR1V7S5_9PEZI
MEETAPSSMSTGDELCDVCSKVDLYSLFTGPRYFPESPDPVSRDDITTHVATLQGVKSNTACPLCRLVKHELYAHNGIDSKYYLEQCDPAKIQCCPRAFRADYAEEPRYQNLDTGELMATRLEVRLVGSDTCSEEELSIIKRYSWGSGLRLLSPDSVVPSRPLFNGFRVTNPERGLELLKQWVGTYENDHVDTCQLDSLNDLPLSLGLETIQVIDLRDRSLRAFDPKTIKYASLSYVWDEAGDEHRDLFSTLQTKEGVGGEDSEMLPSHVPGIIEEAMMVCKRLSIPYLWVDLFCIRQADLSKKASEIKAMGYIYRLSHLTIVSGTSHLDGTHLALTTSLDQGKQPLGSRQRIETIGTRQLSYESDRLDAISGCLNILSHTQRVHFHYALLWSRGEYDQRREGFSSWSWAAWYALNQAHYVHLYDESSGALTLSNDGTYTYQDPETKFIELHGALVGSGVEQAHQRNRCAQSLAQLSVSEANGILTIESEVVRFFVDIKANSSPPNYDLAKKKGWGLVPCDFDSTEGLHTVDWEQDKEYRLPRGRICLRNASGDVYPIHFPPGEHWPTFHLALPYTLRGSTLMWLLSQGIELVKIMEIELLEGAKGLEPLRHVLCLGIDRGDGHPDCVQRMGMAFLPKEAWEKAGPKKMTVKFR